jgi:transposase
MTTPSPTATLLPCLGLDAAKAKIDACLLLSTRVHHHQFDNSKAGLAALRAWCQKLGAPTPLTVLEATGRYSDLAALTLQAAGHRVHLANARRIKDYARSLGRRNKTDRLDAQLIAEFGRTRTLPAWQPPTPAQAHLRMLLRRRADLAAMRQAERNRQDGLVLPPALAKSLTRIQRALAKELQTLDAQIAAHTQATPELHADVQRLCAIAGIGECTALWLCAELPRHLPNARAAAPWLAVTPRVRQSGVSLRRTAPIGAEGNRHLRRVLFMAALVARRHNPRLKTFADRLAANGKSKLSVICAVLHKLLKISFAVLKNQSAYHSNHHPLQPYQI